MKGNKTPSKRGEVQGWSHSATRRNTAFLRSIDSSAIQCTEDGEPLTAIALTLTVRDCPESHDKWEQIRQSYIKRLRRLGLYRFHWVTEWQRRGVPHLHGCFFFPEAIGTKYQQLTVSLVNAWLELCTGYGAQRRGQYTTPVYDVVGWFKYLSKHASRGVYHYQRSQENAPELWRKTGRMWGKGGDWPVDDKQVVQLSNREFYMLRRIARSWRKSDARSSGSRKRISSSRRMLKCSDPDLSKLRGVSEWLDIEKTSILVDYTKSIIDQSAPSTD